MKKVMFALIASIAMLIGAGAVLLVPDNIVDGATRSEGVGNWNTIWEDDIVFMGTDPIDGVAMGNTDSDPETELVWVSRDQKTYLGHYDESGDFSYEAIWTAGGQQLTPAIGDLRPDIPGNEIIVVGLSSGTEDDNPGDGTATVLTKFGTSWNPERALTDTQLIHGADIGDLDPTIPGEEAVVTTFSHKAFLVWWDTDKGAWNSSEIFEEEGNVRKVVIADILPSHPGNEMVAVSKAGNVTVAYGNKDDWTVDVIYSNPDEPFARIAVGDVDPAVPGLEIYGGTDTFKVFGFKRSGDSWTSHEIFVDTNKNRGVWVADVDPNIDGNELYSYGYSTKLVQITGSFAGGWNTRELWNDVARGHEIRIGDLDPTNDFKEIALVGYAANVSIIKPSGWVNDVPFKGTDPIDGIAIGNTDADSQLELVWVSRDQKTYMGHYDDAGDFSYEAIWTAGGQQLTPAIGDLRSDIPGNEIIVVGLSSGTEDDNPGDGTATVLTKSGTTWTPERAYTDPQLIHGADIGDLDPTIPGEEAVVTTFSHKAIMIWWDTEKGEWNSSEIFEEEGNVRKVVIADVLPDNPGNEMVAVSKSGNVTVAYGNKDEWTVDVIYSNPDEPFARVAVGDVDPNVPGMEIYGGTDTFKVFGFRRSGNDWTSQEIFLDNNKNRGVWVADVDPDIEGAELYSFGYSTRLVQITGTFSGGWSTKDLFHDMARGHEIRIGDFHPNDGKEIAVVGYASNVTIVSLMEPVSAPIPTVSGDSTLSVDSESSATAKVQVSGDSYMTITADDVTGATVKLVPGKLFIQGTVEIIVTAGVISEDSIQDMKIYVDYGGGKVEHTIQVTLKADETAPSVSEFRNPEGDLIQDGDAVMWNDTIEITMSEPVSRSSFEAAVSGGLLKV
ncbi:MAG: hypothetical protein ACMUHB_05635, partial [Thermoplasmatota archaeon]